MENKKLILASASPRRREILQSAGYVFDVISPDCDEVSEGYSPASLTVENSKRKALAALSSVNGVIVCADTVVVSPCGEVLGKPGCDENARAMLKDLSGKVHSVITGYTVTDGEKTVSGYVETRVFMRHIHEDEIESYVTICRPLDKAGAYGIQGKGAVFIEGIEGDYFNVMGLPLHKLSLMLKDFGFSLL